MKTVLVTGATSGIGYETAKEVVKRGDRLIMISRSKPKTERCIEEWKTLVPTANIEPFYADLASMREIQTACNQIKEKYDIIDVLINNAGIFLAQRENNIDGWEKTFAVNHMSYFAVTHFLLPLLKASRSARIVNVASRAHWYGHLDLDTVCQPTSYRGQRVYGTSKLCNILFTHELARRLQGAVTANSLHPGVVRTNIANGQGGPMGWAFRILGRLFLSPQKGAKTTIFLAYDESMDTETGGYYAKCKRSASSVQSQDDELARSLWDYSSRLLSDALEEV